MKDIMQFGYKGNFYVYELQFDLIRVDMDENDNIFLVEVIKFVWDQDESNCKIKEEIVRKLKFYEGESFDKFRMVVMLVYGIWKWLD